MKTIHKFSLDIEDGPQPTRMPVGAAVRAVALQGARISIWAEVDTDEREEERRTFHVVGTGHTLPENAVYVGMVPQGPYIWHVVEARRG